VLGAALQRITLLVYDDIEAAHDFLVTVFGFSPGQLIRDAAGQGVHGEVHVGDGVVWLHRVAPERGLASPRTLGASTHCMAVIVDVVDRHCERTRSAGAIIIGEPRNVPYGYLEYDALDCEGGYWSFMTPLEITDAGGTP
jgi:MerR family transcriptional regulator, thiopeptide resistance regulator